MSSGSEQEKGFDVFLSHNSQDKPAVRALARALVQRGISVWLDEEQLPPGLPWQELLEEAIKGSRTVAVLVGKDGLGPWADEEMRTALNLACKDKRPVIPVLLPGAGEEPELPLFLTNRTWVDLRSGLDGEGFDRLIWGISGVKPKQPVPGAIQVSPSSGQSLFDHVPERLLGRQQELADLDAAWADPGIRVLSYVAWGGVGKSSLVATWMAQRDVWNHPDIERVFEWSFYSQGTREQGNPSADAFVSRALSELGDPGLAQSKAAARDKGIRLAQLVAEKPTLLILDGLEPLQQPPGPRQGRLKDPALEALLTNLARRNCGLCLVTTRESVTDLAPWHSSSAPERILDHLPEAAGKNLLSQLGVKGSDRELTDLVRKVRSHALTLNLLGRFLSQAHQGDIRRSELCQFAEADAQTQGGHAFKVMGAYERWLAASDSEGQCQLSLLRVLGLFDRPAQPGCILALRQKPAIGGLTEPLIDLDQAAWNITLSQLQDCYLISLRKEQSALSDQPSAIDAHPLLREYFAQQLQDTNPEAWRAGHQRLYTYLTETADHQPDTLEGLQPLYQAVTHGCRAGLYQEVCEKVYFERINRGQEFYSTRKLGAFGSDLGAVACFFDVPWTRVSPEVSEGYQAWLLHQAAFRLRALGRLTEALEPMRVSGEMDVSREEWEGAAISYGNLSELELTLGHIDVAVSDAEQSVTFADRTEDAFEQLKQRAKLADPPTPGRQSKPGPGPL